VAYYDVFCAGVVQWNLFSCSSCGFDSRRPIHFSLAHIGLRQILLPQAFGFHIYPRSLHLILPLRHPCTSMQYYSLRKSRSWSFNRSPFDIEHSRHIDFSGGHPTL
jgi:hypothetical protein